MQGGCCLNHLWLLKSLLLLHHNQLAAAAAAPCSLQIAQLTVVMAICKTLLRAFMRSTTADNRTAAGKRGHLWRQEGLQDSEAQGG
jgi:hypothetical protein